MWMIIYGTKNAIFLVSPTGISRLAQILTMIVASKCDEFVH